MAEKEAEFDMGAGGAGCALTAVNPPALTGVKPEDAIGLAGSGVGVGTFSPCSVAFNAADALMAGDSAAFVGVP